jgi:hypothetical protein
LHIAVSLRGLVRISGVFIQRRRIKFLGHFAFPFAPRSQRNQSGGLEPQFSNTNLSDRVQA